MIKSENSPAATIISTMVKAFLEWRKEGRGVVSIEDARAVLSA